MDAPASSPCHFGACSLLLATGRRVLLALTGDNLAQHDHAVAVHEGDSRKTLAVLEGVADKWLLRLEAALRHLVRLERVWLFHLLAAGLLAHLPDQLRDPACRSATPDKANGRVANLDLVGDVEHLNLRIELARLSQRGVLLVHHDVARPWHVVLVEALDVQANVVARVGKVNTLVVHLHSEHLAGAGVRGRVRGEEDHLLTGLHHALLDAAGENVTDALDLVDAADGHPHRRTDRPLGHAAQLVEHVIDRVHVDGFLAVLDILTLPPGHVLGLLEKVVPHPAGNGQHWCVLLNEIFLPTHLHKHALHLVGNLVVARLLVSGRVAVHLVHADANLFHTQKVDEP
mmetsp:Transcript_73712/g.208779  ORF Transcript_73712/g.208779 Transcript_73712/m.208779 type:complete len:344 (-) Transcript_73712:164-1195(-)